MSKCAGWGVECRVPLGPDEERIFGEVILCGSCDDLAWDDFFAACRAADERDKSEYPSVVQR